MYIYIGGAKESEIGGQKFQSHQAGPNRTERSKNTVCMPTCTLHI